MFFIGDDRIRKYYQKLIRLVAERCESYFLEDAMIVGTSAMIETELDCIVNQYTDKFCNPMVMWGKNSKMGIKLKMPLASTEQTA